MMELAQDWSEKKNSRYKNLQEWMARIWDVSDDKQSQYACDCMDVIMENFNIEDDISWSEAEKALRDVRRQKEGMAAPGTLGLPDLLERARWQHMIPDGAFEYEAVYDRVWIFQISEFSLRKATGGLLVVAETTMDRERIESPQGIIVTAGLQGLDAIRNNGMDLGHHVTFAKNYVQRIRVDWTEGRERYLAMVLAGDISSSKTLRSQIAAGEVKPISRMEGGYFRHGFINTKGVEVAPPDGYVHMGDI